MNLRATLCLPSLLNSEKDSLYDKMKICFIGNAKSIHMQRFAKFFVDKGHDVYLITSSQAEMDGVKIYIIGNGKEGNAFNFIRKIVQTRKFVRKINPDILHAHYIFGPGIFGAFSGHHPFIITPWGSDILIDPSFKLKKIAVKHTLKKVDVITCDAQHLRESMIKLGAEDRKINIIYFGTDVSKFSPQKKDKTLKKKLGLDGSPVVISLRALKPIYNIESLVMAIPIVLKQIPEAKFIIAGQGPEEKMLKDLASSLNVSDSVIFVGLIPNDDLPNYLTASDVYVSTSLSDAGLAASTAEAMACELPVIITDFGANAEWIQDGKNGFLVPMKNSKSLADKIIVLLKDKNLREKFGKKGRQLIKERLDYDTEMSKMERIYEELIKK